jgi:signal transduction histidine kinase
VIAGLAHRLRDRSTYRRLLFVLSGLPLGHIWLVALVVGWSLCVAFAITPVVIATLLGLAAMTRGFATVEAAIARPLLDVEVAGPQFPHWTGKFWRFFGAMLGAAFWRGQAYLLIRAFVGVALGSIVLGLLVGALAMIAAPAWLPLLSGGAHLGFWRPHTFAESLVLVPVGLVILAATLLLASGIAGLFRPLACTLLKGQSEVDPGPQGVDVRLSASAPPQRALKLHAAVDASIVASIVLIWALTSRGYFWPVWVMLALGVALGIHGWFVLLAERPSLVRRFGGDRALAGSAGIGAAIALYLIAVWAITGAGYFWPVWPILGIAALVGLWTAAVRLAPQRRAELTERIETLESSRAGAVDAQESALRRIERDLHDGAQARLVALGMSLGMAEHTLADDPARAGELLAEARVGAEQALRELRDLARGIHPPVLGDRGLEAAVSALASATPLDVTLWVDVPERPAPAVESAAYFMVAEALANAAKHARAERLVIRIARVADTLEVTVEDDGRGGADVGGAGLSGLRHRVEALDGSLQVTSPPGGPTTIRAEIPCA